MLPILCDMAPNFSKKALSTTTHIIFHKILVNAYPPIQVVTRGIQPETKMTMIRTGTPIFIQ